MRRVGALTLAAATAATTFAAAPAQATTQTHRGHGPKVVSHHKPTRPSHRPAAGFRPVHRAVAEVVAMTSPARGQVWFVERAGNGRVVLERKVGNRWSTTRLPIRLESDARVKIHGSAANDVWLTAAGQLWHFDGRRWSRTGLPGGARATTVHDVPGSDVYVGLSGGRDTTGIFRMRRGRWTSLGRPADLDIDAKIGPTYRPTDLTQAEGRWFATWNPIAHNATYSEVSFVLERRGWVQPFQTLFKGAGEYNELGAWLVPSRDVQLALGRSARSLGSTRGGTCKVWIKGSGEQQCTTRWAVGAAALLANGNIVVGGDDYAPTGKPTVQGTFGIRTKAGAEKLVAGDPGDKTLAMAVEPGTSMVWAATKKGGTTTIQSWKG